MRERWTTWIDIGTINSPANRRKECGVDGRGRDELDQRAHRRPFMHALYAAATAFAASPTDKSRAQTHHAAKHSSHRPHPPSSPQPVPLPPELLFHIFCHLEPSTLAVSAQVCWLWYTLLKDNVVWKRMCAGRHWTAIEGTKLTPASRLVGDTRRGSAISALSLQNLYPASNRTRSLPNVTAADAGEQYQSDSIPKPVSLAPWKRIYKNNFLTWCNWRDGHCQISSVVRRRGDFEVGLDRDLPMHFDESRVVSIALGDGGKVWDMETGECHFQISGHDGTISAVKFDGTYVITGGIDTTLKIWDIHSGACVRTLIGHTGEIVAVQYDDRLVVSGGEDATIRVWRMATGECITVLEGHDGAVCCLQFDGSYIVSGSADHTIKTWQLPSRTPIRTLAGHTGHVYCLQFSGTRIVSGSEDATIRVWDREAGTCWRVLQGHEMGVVCLQFDENKVVSGSADKTIKVWDLNSGYCLYTLKQHTETVWRLRFTPTKLITSSFDQSLLVWDFADTECGYEEVEQHDE